MLRSIFYLIVLVALVGTAEPRLRRERRLANFNDEFHVTESSESGSASKSADKKKTKKKKKKKKRTGENNCHHETLQISTTGGDTFCDYAPCVDGHRLLGSFNDDFHGNIANEDFLSLNEDFHSDCPLELTFTILDEGQHPETDGDCRWCLVGEED